MVSALVAMMIPLVSACGGTSHYLATTRTWTWDGARWNGLSDASVGGGPDQHLAYDPSHDELLLVGSNPNALGSTTATLTAGRWASSKTSTPYTANWTMAYDTKKQHLLMFDGDSVYYWTGRDWIKTAIDRGPPTGDAAAISGTAPDPIAYDPALDSVLTWDVNCFRPAPTAVRTWDGTNWSLQPGGPGTSYGDLVFDPATNQMVMLGGDCTGQTVSTWVFDGKTWTQLHPPVEPTLATGAKQWDYGEDLMAYDPDTGQVILVGQSTLWAWDGFSWRELSNSNLPHGVSREPNNGHNTIQIAYDIQDHVLVAVSTAIACDPCISSGLS